MDIHTIDMEGTRNEARDFEFTAAGETLTQIRDALVTAVDGDADVSAVAGTGAGDVDISADVAGVPYEVLVTSSGAGSGGEGVDLDFTAEENRSWFHVVTGCKVSGFAIAGRAGSFLVGRFKVMGQIARKNKMTVVDCQSNGGTDVDALVVPKDPDAHYRHADLIFLRKPSGRQFELIVTEWDLAWENDTEHIMANNGLLTPNHIEEGERTFIVNLKTHRTESQMKIISERDPTTDLGQVDFRLTIDQPGGFFMDLHLDSMAVTPDPKNLGEGVRRVEESFVLTQVGVPTLLDLNKAA